MLNFGTFVFVKFLYDAESFYSGGTVHETFDYYSYTLTWTVYDTELEVCGYKST